MRARLAFITTRALNEAEAAAMTALAKVKIPKIDPSISLVVQPNYIKRPLWSEHPERDVLGGIPTIGWINQAARISRRARRPRAHGALGEGAGTSQRDGQPPRRRDGGARHRQRRIGRSHLKSAVWHLVAANPAPEVVSFADHAAAIVAELRAWSSSSAA